MVFNVVERHIITQSQTGEKEENFTINGTAWSSYGSSLIRHWGEGYLSLLTKDHVWLKFFLQVHFGFISFRENFLLPFQDQITKFMAPCSLDHPNPDLKFLGIMSPRLHLLGRSFSPILLTSVLGARTTFPFSTLDIWEGRYIAGFLLLSKWHCFSGEEVFC